MTTPKELADKARKLASDMQCRARDASKTTTVDTLCATIDQLQAMAEARQDSGEPVAWVAETADGRKRIELPGHVSGMDAAYGFKRTPLYTAPPSAQQATGSGQVLTDGFSYAASKQMAVTKEWCRGWDACRAALAAATQAQPEDATQKPDYQGFARAILAVLPGIDTLAAPTTGKREPLTDAQIEDYRGEANRGFCIDRDDYFKAFRDAEHAHGITGEQR